jgi:uncharacterized membrane protein
MRVRGGWLSLALVPPACIAYQFLVHMLLTDAQTPEARVTLALLNGIPHAAINALMLWMFGRTFFLEREPLVTGFARRVHGSLPPHIERYTRHVTLAWCVFFAAQIVVSAILLAAGALDRWSFFVNVLSCPLIGAMFIAEYLYRVARFRDFPHVSLWEGIQAFVAHTRAAGPTEPRSQI